MRPPRLLAPALTVAAVLAAVVGLTGDHRFPAPSLLPGPPRDAPRVVVGLGDSTMSGEGAGDYEPDTDGEDGNWCHRSSRASVSRLRLPWVDRTINLACSGAPSGQIGIGDVVQYTEPSQAQRLAELATENRVVAVVVAVGANDEPAFSHVLDACVKAWGGSGAGCGETVGPNWQRRVDAMVPKVVRALTDVRAALRGVGYTTDDYHLVLQSYAAPVGPNMADGLQNLSGCPLRSDDLRWVRDHAVPTLTAGLREAARQADVRFLDLSRAGAGREACASDDPEQEWFRRLAVRWLDLQHDDRAPHALQESFHPNAAGHAQFARCLAEFLNTPDRAAACLPGADGDLHAATSAGT